MNHFNFLREIARHEYYIDVKREHKDGQVLEAMSLTGLEALFLGCKVINWKGDIIKKFPEIHKGRRIAKQLHELYTWGHFI